MEIENSDPNQTKFDIEKDEESSKPPNNPMGDFDYEENPTPSLSSDCSSSDFSEEILLNAFTENSEKLLEDINVQMIKIKQEIDDLVTRIDDCEEDVFKRQDLSREISRLNVEFGKQIGREIEQIEKIDSMIDNLQGSIATRRDLLENFKASDGAKISDHFRKEATESESRFPRENSVKM